MTVEPFHILAGTGSRSLQTADLAVKQEAADLTRDRVVALREVHGDRLVVMSGMAEGFDACLAHAALGLGVPLWCAIPNRRYGAYYWGHHSLTGENRLAEFRSIRDRASRVTHVMEDVYRVMGSLYLNGVHANMVRNSWMVDAAHEFVVWNPTSKGTAHCLAEIRKAGKPYEVLSEAALPI